MICFFLFSWILSNAPRTLSPILASWGSCNLKQWFSYVNYTTFSVFSSNGTSNATANANICTPVIFHKLDPSFLSSIPTMFINTSLFSAMSFLHLCSKLPTISITSHYHSLTYVSVEYHLGLVGGVLDERVDDLSAEQLVLVGLLWHKGLPRDQHRAQVSHEVVQALTSVVLF